MVINYDELRPAFPKMLKRRRCAKNMSQVDLAAASGVADSYISRLEKGDRMPSIDVVFRIAGALGIQPETLVKDLKSEFAVIKQAADKK